MKDYARQEIVIGDKVATFARNYRDMISGEIISMSAQQITISYKNHNGYDVTYRLYPHNCMKINV